jgi:hypothetical protein
MQPALPALNGIPDEFNQSNKAYEQRKTHGSI